MELVIAKDFNTLPQGISLKSQFKLLENEHYHLMETEPSYKKINSEC
jgi:hypothetical protein